MDPLTASIIVILSKYALDKGLELGKEVGPTALEKAKEIYALTLNHISQNRKGEVIAGEFEADPETYQKPVEKALTEAVQADPALAEKLDALLKQYEQAKTEYAGAGGVVHTGSGDIIQAAEVNKAESHGSGPAIGKVTGDVHFGGEACD